MKNKNVTPKKFLIQFANYIHSVGDNVKEYIFDTVIGFYQSSDNNIYKNLVPTVLYFCNVFMDTPTEFSVIDKSVYFFRNTHFFVPFEFFGTRELEALETCLQGAKFEGSSYFSIRTTPVDISTLRKYRVYILRGFMDYLLYKLSRQITNDVRVEKLQQLLIMCDMYKKIFVCVNLESGINMERENKVVRAIQKRIKLIWKKKLE